MMLDNSFIFSSADINDIGLLENSCNYKNQYTYVYLEYYPFDMVYI